jgi:hypothetical protein
LTVRNGFLIVASLTEEYVHTANYCANSIKDNYPDAHITLFTTNSFLSLVDHQAFDLVISEDVPNHVRTKLYALSKTPYTNLTAYIDADMECMHTDVSTIWDEIPEDVDILITKIRPYNGKISKWKTGELIHHGGFFVYRNNPKTIDFMGRWWKDYFIQRKEPWPYEEEECPSSLQQWDQFTFWKLLNVDKLDVKVDFFNDDARWNFVNGYKKSETSSPIIFWHHTVPSKHVHIGLGNENARNQSNK